MSDFDPKELRRLSEAATLRRAAPRFGRPAGSASAKLAAASGLARNDHVWMSTHCSERCAGNRRSQHESAATTPPLPRRDGAAVSAASMRIGSLFSGIGGLELGLERAGVGHTVWQVEKDSFCRRVLAKHWPSVERYEDVREVGSASLSMVDVICGGFPCQDVSGAGKGAGLAGARSGLWYEYRRIVSETRPRFVVVENVASGARRWLPHVRRDLHVLGYRTRAFSLSAFNVGAPHLRRRMFVLAANPERVSLRDEQGWRGGSVGDRAPEPVNDGTDRIASDANSVRELQPQGSERQQWRWSRNSSGWQAEPPVCGVDDGPARRLDRARRLKALGNAVVPQCAEVIGRILRDATKAVTP